MSFRMTKIREQFPITKNQTFLNHAAQSPLPQPVADILHKHVEESSNFGITPVEWRDGGKPFFAKLIGSKPEEIACIENTSFGLNLVANMLPFSSGSKIVTTDLEFPSVVYPWLLKSPNLKVHYVKNVDGKILCEDLEKAVDDQTVAIVVSHVEYVNGFRHDLKGLSEIAHEHGAYLIVDAIQSAGALQIDVKRDNVDFLATACYKWLLSPPGAGYLYVKDELVERLKPPFVGWASVKDEVFDTADFWDIWNLKLSETASRFEVGSHSVLSFLGAREAIQMLLDYGIANIENRILKLTGYLIETVKDFNLQLQTPEELQYRSGIVNIKMKKSQEFVERLYRKDIIVSARTQGIRISPHFYNTEEEICTLVEEIRKIRKIM